MVKKIMKYIKDFRNRYKYMYEDLICKKSWYFFISWGKEYIKE